MVQNCQIKDCFQNWFLGARFAESLYSVLLFVISLIFFKINLLLCWVSVAVVWASSGCGKQRLLSSCGVQASHHGGFSHCRAQAPGHKGFSSCDSWAPEHCSVIVAHGSVAPQNVGSSRTKDQTHVPCITGRILNHQITSEVQYIPSYKNKLVLIADRAANTYNKATVTSKNDWSDGGPVHPVCSSPYFKNVDLNLWHWFHSCFWLVRWFLWVSNAYDFFLVMPMLMVKL